MYQKLHEVVTASESICISHLFALEVVVSIFNIRVTVFSVASIGGFDNIMAKLAQLLEKVKMHVVLLGGTSDPLPLGSDLCKYYFPYLTNQPAITTAKVWWNSYVFKIF